MICFHWNVFAWLLYVLGAWIAQGVICLGWFFVLFVFFDDVLGLLGIYLLNYNVACPMEALCSVSKKGHVVRKLF